MDSEKKIRLIQIAKEFQVGLSSINDFLHTKGIVIDASPNTLVTAYVYEIIKKKFGTNRPSNNNRENIHENITTKQPTISGSEMPKSITTQKPQQKHNLEICSYWPESPMLLDDFRYSGLLGPFEPPYNNSSTPPKKNKIGYKSRNIYNKTRYLVSTILQIAQILHLLNYMVDYILGNTVRKITLKSQRQGEMMFQGVSTQGTI